MNCESDTIQPPVCYKLSIDSRLSKRKEEKLSDNNELFVDEWSGSKYELDENGLVQNLRPSNEINYNKFDNEDIKLMNSFGHFNSIRTINEKAKITFLGDSILDCDSYTKSNKTTIDFMLDNIQIQGISKKDKEELVNDQTVDGYTIYNVLDSCKDVNDNSEYVVISAGGNDLLGALPLLSKQVDTNEMLALLNRELDKYLSAYKTVIGKLKKKGRKFMLLTVYDGNPAYDNSQFQGIEDIVETVISMWNDRLYRLASDLDYVEVVDTRNVMDETCYYNDIEPNDKGAKRIGKQIFNWLWYNNAFKELKGI